jgi:ceramide glucosyltransferase
MTWMVMRWLVVLLALSPFFYYMLCIYAARKFFHSTGDREGTPSDFTPPVSILKPVRGLDREAYENFASFCQQDYPEYEILFCVGEPDDPVIRVIRQLTRDFPGTQIRLLIGTERLGNNDKVCKLARMAREARYEVLIESDSDVRVERDYLRVVVAPFRDPRVGGVTTLFRGMAEKGWVSRMDCVGASAEFCAGAMAAKVLEGVKFAHGATMATTKERLAEIGGFEALADLHADDFEFGNRIAARGYRVEMLPNPVWMVYPEETLREYLQHERRWTIGLRNIRPWAHFGLIFSQGILWMILVALVAPAPAIFAAYVAAYLVLRMWMAWEVGVRGLRDPVLRRNLWLLPVRDALAVGVWLASFFSRRISWRGEEFLIRKGALVRVTSKGAANDALVNAATRPGG